ncbi:MAG: ATP phosphoribosyltransferase [Desulfobacteraceae bacterium]|nr:ATP phosphoribosyltransferase [Desulfobacteraceae bacterium]MCB9495204.1 ATP phosphoribosyltransferase [Desulfobacteraceae bacterium]
MLKIALPNKGSLSEDAVTLVKAAGYSCRRIGKELMVSDSENKVDFVFLRPRDIAVYVSRGILDMGITGRDLALDSKTNVHEIFGLGFGKSSFCYACKTGAMQSVKELNNKRIATSYPEIVGSDLKKNGLTADIVKLDGAVEISIELGVADAIADVVETGRTMKEAGLEVLGSPVLKSEAVLISRTPDILKNKDVFIFTERIKGILTAREYVIIEYDVEEKLLEEAASVTPGIESPTVSPLSKKGWIAVKSMVRKKDVNHMMDRLAEIGARGIIVSDIRTCRL